MESVIITSAVVILCCISVVIFLKVHYIWTKYKSKNELEEAERKLFKGLLVVEEESMQVMVEAEMIKKKMKNWKDL